MSNTRILKKDHLLPLLRKLSKTHRLVAPVCNEYGDTLFSEIDDLDATAIDLNNQPQSSIKSYFFPQVEQLSSYIVDREPVTENLEYSFHPKLPENIPTVYFGVRSCDMFAVMYTDMVFLHENEKDIYYEQHRNNAIFISVGCSVPFENCFCNATRSGPFLDVGFDLQLTDLMRATGGTHELVLMFEFDAMRIFGGGNNKKYNRTGNYTARRRHSMPKALECPSF